MGMFDEIICKYPLPKGAEWAQDEVFQTKDTDAQFIDLYEIRKDGTLWHQNYAVEDRSDKKAKGLKRILGCATRVNKRWVKCPHNGVLQFYTSRKKGKGWEHVEFVAVFRDGKMKRGSLKRLKGGSR